ncbi:AMP-binding protein [Aestuariibacter sp. A3R04]|uniref:AMP-binding protein n=1 Tax=Aestuariibacter sp. A3R04 TaxID=2841571 RepID=UPI001C099CDD|nr:AMP-binding protein [Aestuariibacter sp. A3R04]
MSTVFWRTIEKHESHQKALITDASSLTYRELCQQVARWETRLNQVLPQRGLVALRMGNTPAAICAYLACLRLTYPVILYSPALSEAGKAQMRLALSPALLIDGEEITVWQSGQYHLDENLAVILTTSGSTGGGKYVALSYDNLRANTNSIIDYLPMIASDVALLTLPLSYSYGLSVLNTHLEAGASIHLTTMTILDKGFWQLLETASITSLSGVPSFYEMLIRLRFTNRALPQLRYFTQAGGKLAGTHVKTLSDYADKYNKQFFVMYGQTEATARMSYLSPDRVSDKPDSIGRPVPGGAFLLVDDNGELIESAGVDGELVYQGPNTMLGYVASASELGTFTPESRLYTGDVARRDEDGDYYISGRKKRFVKLFGERLSLDGLENLFEEKGFSVKVAGQDDFIVVACHPSDEAEVINQLGKIVTCPPKARCVIGIGQWPLLANGKTDYASILKMAAS